jgi:hypothetical protein
VSDVRFRFVATGQDSVVSAFKGITASAREAQKAQSTAARAVSGGAGRGGSIEERRFKEAEKAAAKIQREFDKEAKAAQRAAQSKIRSDDGVAKAAIRNAERVAQARARADKASERSALAIARTAERAAEKRAKAEQRAQAMAIGIRGQRLERIAGMGKDAVLSGAAGLGAVGVGLVGSAARDSMRLQEAANRLSINSRGAGQEYADPTKLRKEFEATAQASPGIKSSDVADALSAFVAKTGNLGVARGSQGTFATVASATGADIKDVADAAADLFMKFDIKSVEDMEKALSALTYQGKQGSFELKDAAGQFAKLSAAAERFGLDKGASGVSTLGGLTQIARGATGSPEAAATAIEAMMTQLVLKSGEIKKDLGVDVFTDKSNTKTNDIRQVIGKTIAGAGGDLTKLQKIFDVQGIRAVTPLISTFNQARNKSTAKDEAGKTADGLKALNEQLNRAIDAPGTFADIQQDAARAQATSSAQLTAAWEKLQAAVGEQLTPKLVEAAAVFTNFVQNSNAIENLVTVFVALAEAGAGVVDVMKELGLIKTKKMTADEKAKKAQKEFDEFNQTMDKKGLAVTAADIAKREELAGKVTAAKQEGLGITGDKSASEFASKYSKAAGVSEADATRLAMQINQDPNSVSDKKFNFGDAAMGAMAFGGLGSMAGLFGDRGENADAKAMRENYQGQVTHQQMNDGSDEAKKRVEAGGSKLMGALTGLATQIEALSMAQASIFSVD